MLKEFYIKYGKNNKFDRSDPVCITIFAHNKKEAQRIFDAWRSLRPDLEDIWAKKIEVGEKISSGVYSVQSYQGFHTGID